MRWLVQSNDHHHRSLPKIDLSVGTCTPSCVSMFPSANCFGSPCAAAINFEIHCSRTRASTAIADRLCMRLLRRSSCFCLSLPSVAVAPRGSCWCRLSNDRAEPLNVTTRSGSCFPNAICSTTDAVLIASNIVFPVEDVRLIILQMLRQIWNLTRPQFHVLSKETNIGTAINSLEMQPP